jgi:hypothetical protein
MMTLKYTEQHRVIGKAGMHVVDGEIRDITTGTSIKTHVTIDRYDNAAEASRIKYGHIMNLLNDSDNPYLCDIVRTVRNNPFATLMGMAWYVKQECPASTDITADDLRALMKELSDKTGRKYSFVEFKSYLIDHMFSGVD